jgi:hypothetical protein
MKNAVFGTYVPPKPKVDYIISSEWQNHLNNPIKRAIYEQDIKFVLKVDIQKLKEDYPDKKFVLVFNVYNYHSDGKDELLNLVYRNSKGQYNREIIEEENVEIVFKITEDIQKGLELYNLYFKCSIQIENGKNLDFNIKMPQVEDDYLKVGVLVIDRFKMPGLNREGTDIAEDMTYGYGIVNKKKIYESDILESYKRRYIYNGFNKLDDYLFCNEGSISIDKDILSEKAIYTLYEMKELGFFNLVNHEIENKVPESSLWKNFRDMTLFLEWGIEGNIDKMIDKFYKNEGGIYENEELTKAILNNPATESYCKKVDSYIIKKIKSNFSNIEGLEDLKPYFIYKNENNNDIYFNGKERERVKDFGSPAYTYKKDWNVLRGETIALNDIWATEVYLQTLVFEKGGGIKGKYKVILWDHFGLDKPDLEKFYSLGAGVSSPEIRTV